MKSRDPLLPLISPKPSPGIPQTLETGLCSIVIVNSNGRADTLNCIKTIEANPPGCEYETWLVDNCSRQTIADLADRFESVRVLEAPEPQSFAKNYNLGMRHAQGQWIIILNNDTLVQPDALDQLITNLADPEVAFTGPLLTSPDGQVQTNCARGFVTPAKWVLNQVLLHSSMPAGRLWERYRAGRIRKMETGMVQAISGACMAVRRDVLEAIGFLDEGYPLYFEEDEWCHRAWRKGYRVRFVREAVVVHLGDRSISSVREWSRRREYRSALRYLRDYHGLSRIGEWVVWGATLAGYLERLAAFALVRRDTGNAAIYRRLIGWLWGYRPDQDGGAEGAG